jgi:hypothetical protein
MFEMRPGQKMDLDAFGLDPKGETTERVALVVVCERSNSGVLVHDIRMKDDEQEKERQRYNEEMERKDRQH